MERVIFMLKGATKTTMLLSFFVRKSFPGMQRQSLQRIQIFPEVLSKVRTLRLLNFVLQLTQRHNKFCVFYKSMFNCACN